MGGKGVEIGYRQLFLKSFVVIRTREIGVGSRVMCGCRESSCEHVCRRKRRWGPMEEQCPYTESHHLKEGFGQVLPLWQRCEGRRCMDPLLYSSGV